jgi:hypothetical protein
MSEPKTYAVNVTDPNGLRVSLRIVKAHSRAQAIRHVAADTITASLATFEDGQEAARLDVEPEDATTSSTDDNVRLGDVDCIAATIRAR